jgi:hypothetical protein
MTVAVPPGAKEIAVDTTADVQSVR